MLLVMNLSSCSSLTSSRECIIFPPAGIKVGNELEKIPYQGYENFWEWMGRLNKLKQELEIPCK